MVFQQEQHEQDGMLLISLLCRMNDWGIEPQAEVRSINYSALKESFGKGSDLGWMVDRYQAVCFALFLKYMFKAFS